MKKLTLYSKGLVPLGFHGTDTCLYQVPGRRDEQDLEMVLVNMTKTKTRKSCKTKTKTKTFKFEENEKIVKKYIF